MSILKLTIALTLICGLYTLGCTGKPSPDSPLSSGGKIHGARAKVLVSEGALLLDVRSPQEFAQGHLEDAINIPVQSLAQRITELPQDKQLIVYCRSGRRSAKATALIQSRRQAEVYDLGPMSAFPQ